ncbi:MFS transporter [Algoriphagus sp. SE2]|uniref:MFS transporter n=1 Tax=Algoriphagus sp. SE2 TaxID=3141536 RepID=UPI0031CD1FCB
MSNSKLLTNPVLGLKANWKQFLILVIVNALVGSMLGMERSIFPQYASEIFGLSSNFAFLSFITAFGFSKAFTNYLTGKFANNFGRKKLLILGWVLATPVPLLLIFASNWNQVILANVLLGVSQGLTWGSTVIMKIDLVGEKDRGFAMGMNEFAGYLSLGISAYLSAYLADEFGISPTPFYIGIVVSILGLLLSIFLVRDTHHFVKKESETATLAKVEGVFLQTSIKNKTLSSITQAGLINNLNDGMVWGLLPVLLLSNGFSLNQTGIITATYPLIWGFGQLGTGKMADRFSKKKMIFIGMLLQGFILLLIPNLMNYHLQIFLMVLLGIGTALVYPTFMAAIADHAHPVQRAESIGTFRLWRDLGYAFGAILSGILADQWGIPVAIISIGILTILSSIFVKFRMKETLPTSKIL